MSNRANIVGARKEILAFAANRLRWALKLGGMDLTNADLEVLRPEVERIASGRIRTLYLGRGTGSAADRARSNKLEHLPDWLVAKCDRAQTIDLEGNRLTTLPASLATCVSLTKLNMRDNPVEKFPAVIGELSNLRELDAREQKFRELPACLGKLHQLRTLAFDRNRVWFPPEQQLYGDIQRTLDFLRSTDKQGGAPFHSAKVLLVGNGGAGKTTLRKWLTEKKFVSEAATIGGESDRLIVPITQNVSETGLIELWDFGGQERYRAAQRTLFSRGALFVLVCNSRSNVDEGGAPEWLQLIRLVQKDAKVLLVFTHHDEKKPLPPRDGIPRRLREMVPPQNVYSIEASTGRGIDQIQKRIIEEARLLNSWKSPYPIQYHAAKRELDNISAGKQLGERYYEAQEFRSVCLRHELEDADQLTLAQLICPIKLVDDADELPRLIPTEPEWLLKAVSQLMDDVTITGEFSYHEHAERVWNGSASTQGRRVFPKKAWPHILDVLANQGLAFRLGRQNAPIEDSTFLIPELMRGSAPESVAWSYHQPKLNRICKLTAPIYGLAGQLVSRLHRFHIAGQRHYWQSGGFFKDVTAKAELMVEVDGRDTVYLDARGPGAQAILADAIGALRSATDVYWPETRGTEEAFEVLVPCLKEDCDGVMSFQQLETLNRRGNVIFPCTKGHENRIGIALAGDEDTNGGDLLGKIMRMIDSKDDLPSILEIEDLPETLTTKRRALYLVSEVTRKRVDSTRRIVDQDKELVSYLRDGVRLAAVGVKLLTGQVEQLLDDIQSLQDDDLEEDEAKIVFQLPPGLIVRRRGQTPPEKIEKLLRDMVRENMEHVLKEDGTYRWVSLQEAGPFKPSEAKES